MRLVERVDLSKFMDGELTVIGGWSPDRWAGGPGALRARLVAAVERVDGLLAGVEADLGLEKAT